MNTRLTVGTAPEDYSKLLVLLPCEQKLKKNKSQYSEIIPPFYMVSWYELGNQFVSVLSHT